MISSIEMIKRYDIISEDYEDRYYTGKDIGNETITKIIKEVVKEYAIQSAVEFGCGTGYWIRLLDQVGIRYILGIDGSEKMLKIAMKKDYKNKVCFQLDNITRIKKIDRKFDLALTSFFISLLEERDFLSFSILQVTKPCKGG